MDLTARNLFSLHGNTPHQDMTGKEGDISNLCQYGWYEWCYFREKKNKFPFNREILGQILCPATGEGVLKANGNVVPRRTCRPLNVAELHSPTEIEKRKIFDTVIRGRWGTSMSPPPTVKGASDNVEEEEYEPYSDED
jgi:hypothetical protein